MTERINLTIKTFVTSWLWLQI